MPKTKQTAKKLIGGVSKRKELGSVKRADRSMTLRSHQQSQSPQPTPDVEMAEATPPGLDAPLVTAAKGSTSDDEHTDHVSHHCSA